MRSVIVHLVVASSLLVIAGCGGSEADRLAKQDRDAAAAQARGVRAVSRAERRSAATGLALIDEARIRCRHARGQIGHSAPADAHRLAVRFAVGFPVDVQPGMVTACAKELAR